MWSEHCSYKSSRLREAPTEGPRVLRGPGRMLGWLGWRWLGRRLQMESHNHPSFIEPIRAQRQASAASCATSSRWGAHRRNSLRFGHPRHPKTAHLVRGVVAGIADYGNCMGVPTVGGKVTFDPSYDGNILVNAFNLRLLRSDRIFRGYATGVGNPVLYVGAKTGHDGIHGATMASDSFDEEFEAKRPTVKWEIPLPEAPPRGLP